uniref:2,4-dienoyl-CoA reductase [(3E)-enoyl-CoA-producing] n=1 Tax=Nephromyces sp. MMRI TaxID=2496275 RepID=A0A3S5HLW3_9APIC|nr:2,4-dienoyl-CoA reductase 2 [Nephromyces sp. MMRI]AZL94583.1 2,4-dienoyl-CoA reductase 2 [Nephromyces sp. MMRI]
METELSSFAPNCFKNKIIVITGGGSGIGKAIALKFMQLGGSTAILSRNKIKLKKTAEELELSTGGRCMYIGVDVRDYEGVSTAIDAVLSEFGTIDVLVNCAAGNFLSTAEKLSLKGFRTVMEIDCYGCFILSHLVFKKVFKYYGGCIVNISMTLHYTGALLQTHAGAAKGAIDSMTRHLAVEWGPYNVRVNGVAPGPIGGTEGMARLDPSGGGGLDLLTRTVPLQRLGTGEDVANAVAFLSLREASYITGTTVVVDGGQWLTSGNFTVLNPSVMNSWIQKAEEAGEEGKRRKRGDITYNTAKL